MVLHQSLNLSEQLEQSHGEFHVRLCLIYVQIVNHVNEVVAFFSLRISVSMCKNSLCIYI